MKDDTIHLIYGSDDNYWFPTAISAASAAYGLGEGRSLVVHLFDLGISDAHYAEFVELSTRPNRSVKCERHQIDAHMFDGYGSWRASVITYSRMFIQEILPDLDWAIYFDGDTLWTGDIGKLWDMRDPSYIIQASVDPPPPIGQNRQEETWYRENGLSVDMSAYFCAGLMMINLREARLFGLTEKCQQFMRRFPRPRVVDQTVLNYVLQGHSKMLSPEWGVFSAWHGTADMTRDGAVHYVTDVPWRRDKVNRLMSDIVMLWYEFADRVMGLGLRKKYVSGWQYTWRRGVFVLLKHMQWVVTCYPYVHSRLRNTHGLSKSEVMRFKRYFNLENG